MTIRKSRIKEALALSGFCMVLAAMAYVTTAKLFDGSGSAATAQTAPSIEQRNSMWTERQRLLQLDNVKPDYFGRLGDFEIVPQPEQANAALLFCQDGQITGIRRGFRQSELNRPGMFAQTLCADGIVVRTYSHTGRLSYFRGTARVFIEAPLDRLKLTDIDGRPALLVEPAVKPGPHFLFAIKRAPTANEPGVLVSVLGHKGLEDALTLARQGLGE